MPIRSYDLKNVICTAAGVPISGFGDSDAIGIEWEGKLAESKVSADGQVTYFRTNDRRLTVTLTLMQTSRAVAVLMPLLEAQHGDNLGIGPPVMAPYPLYMLDPATGDELAGEFVFVSRPAPSKGKEPGELEFELSLPQPRYNFGVRNVL